MIITAPIIWFTAMMVLSVNIITGMVTNVNLERILWMCVDIILFSACLTGVLLFW